MLAPSPNPNGRASFGVTKRPDGRRKRREVEGAVVFGFPEPVMRRVRSQQVGCMLSCANPRPS